MGVAALLFDASAGVVVAGAVGDGDETMFCVGLMGTDLLLAAEPQGSDIVEDLLMLLMCTF